MKKLIITLILAGILFGCGYRIYIIKGNRTVNITLEQFSVEKKGGQYEFSPTVDVAP